MSRWTGRQLEERRGRRTQTDLADALRRRCPGLGTTQTQVSRWESGQQPRKLVLPHLAAELGCSVDELFDADEDEESEADLDAVLTRQAVATIVRATVAETVTETLERLGLNA